MSLDRLINLVKKTGDRLVVHDPINGHDIILMDIDSYEDMLFSAETDRGQMNEAELLDQINRDIAIWRAKRSVDDIDYDDSDESDDFFSSPTVTHHDATQPIFDIDEPVLPFTTDEPIDEPLPSTPKPVVSSRRSPWQSAGQILESRFGQAKPTEGAANSPVEYKENAAGNEWKEEPLTGDEPVFYEEPIG